MSFVGGSFLIAKPSLRDPNFFQTVVLVVQHDPDGAFGLIVNRPVPVKDLPYPVFAGGPCEAQGLFMLHGNPKWAKNCPGEHGAHEVAPGIFLGDSSCAPLLKEVTKKEKKRVRMFANYAGWGPGQLEHELTEGSWTIMPADGETLFKTPPKELWRLLKPPSLPQPSLN